MSDDHPGIVSAVTGAINEIGGNVVSCSQTVLHGYFTLIIIATFPPQVTPDQLIQAVRGPHPEQTGFQVVVRPFAPRPPNPKLVGAERFVVTAFGKDKPGIILRFTQYMADKDINIIDMYGERAQDDFVLITQVELPPRWQIRMIQADLEEMGKEEGFTVRFQHENVFVATNQLRLTRGQQG
jgi:predicted amino acid-binding ACT domain protein